MRLLIAAGSLALLLMAASGCRVRGPILIRPAHPVVKIKMGHKHSHNCGHYHHGGKWFLHKGHVHKARCGHKLKGGIWIRIR